MFFIWILGIILNFFIFTLYYHTNVLKNSICYDSYSNFLLNGKYSIILAIQCLIPVINIIGAFILFKIWYTNVFYKYYWYIKPNSILEKFLKFLYRIFKI